MHQYMCIVDDKTTEKQSSRRCKYKFDCVVREEQLNLSKTQKHQESYLVDIIENVLECHCRVKLGRFNVRSFNFNNSLGQFILTLKNPARIKIQRHAKRLKVNKIRINISTFSHGDYVITVQTENYVYQLRL